MKVFYALLIFLLMPILLNSCGKTDEVLNEYMSPHEFEDEITEDDKKEPSVLYGRIFEKSNLTVIIPIKNARICALKKDFLEEESYDLLSQEALFTMSCTFSSEDGYYKFPLKTTGIHLVIVEARGYERNKLKVNIEKITELNVILNPLKRVRLEGYITSGPQTEIIISPVPNAKVCVSRITRNIQDAFDFSSNRLIQCTESARNGFYSFDNLIPDFYLLTSEAEGFKKFREPLHIYNDMKVYIRMIKEQDLTYVIKGIVTQKSTDEKIPVSGALVCIHSIFLSDNIFDIMPKLKCAISDTDGAYYLDEINEGIYVLTSFHRGFKPHKERINVKEDLKINIFMERIFFPEISPLK